LRIDLETYFETVNYEKINFIKNNITSLTCNGNFSNVNMENLENLEINVIEILKIILL
jgi:hypothetical protein